MVIRSLLRAAAYRLACIPAALAIGALDHRIRAAHHDADRLRARMSPFAAAAAQHRMMRDVPTSDELEVARAQVQALRAELTRQDRALSACRAELQHAGRYLDSWGVPVKDGERQLELHQRIHHAMDRLPVTEAELSTLRQAADIHATSISPLDRVLAAGLAKLLALPRAVLTEPERIELTSELYVVERFRDPTGSAATVASALRKVLGMPARGGV